MSRDDAAQVVSCTFGDVHCKTIEDVLTEVSRRKQHALSSNTITKYEKSLYGGYRVYSRPADLVVDDLVDPIYPRMPRTANIY